MTTFLYLLVTALPTLIALCGVTAALAGKVTLSYETPYGTVKIPASRFVHQGVFFVCAAYLIVWGYILYAI